MVRTAIIFIAILLSFSNPLTAQTRTIYGRVISEDDVDVIPHVLIQTPDKLIVGETDRDGRFKIGVPLHTQILRFSFIGYEPATIKLTDNCDTIEIVLIPAGTYDFMSSRKIDRDRLKWFDKLPEIQLQAYKKGLFTKQSVCYSRKFEPEKPKADSIEKEHVKIRRQIKLTFKKLNIGDTVKIPFSGEYKANGTGGRILTCWSAFTSERNFDCILKCVITGKNRRKKGFNLICEVADSSMCKYPGIFNGKVMKVGEVFDYNMKYFKILKD